MKPHLEWHPIGDEPAFVGIERYGDGARAVCIVHGFLAWHRWGFYPWLAQWFVEQGYAASVLALPSSGYGPDGFSLERFARATISTDLQALRYATGVIKTQSRCIAGLGHSRGGLLLMLAHTKFDCLALWAPPRTLGRWGAHQQQLWRDHGSLPCGTHPESGQSLYLNHRYLDDLEQHRYNEQLDRALEHCTVPTLIVAAEQDMVAPVSGAEQLLARLQHTRSQLYVVSATGHTFGIQHPQTQPTSALHDAMIQTQVWFDGCCPLDSNFAAAGSSSSDSPR
ncbi:MAG: hypothetical protein KatS3mg039_1265 [Candidatus Kapaibacterium sp.]|nr:MAG: hypothetical protein KatS3mg039_1265 [Candidatus Kapabacteria bacterium]